VSQEPSFEETITGGVYDRTGLAFVAFFRISNPSGPCSWSEMMAQTPYGEVFVIEKYFQSGLFRKKSMARLANPSRTVTVEIVDSIETYQDSLVKTFMAANGLHVGQARRDGAKDVSSGFWFPLRTGQMQTVLTFIAKGPFSTLLKPRSS
jgi:hypothetical protein